MTYFELISNLQKLKKEKRNQESYDKFINSDITLYKNMHYRLAIQLISFIRKKIKDAYETFLSQLSKELSTEDKFTMNVIDLKNELMYIQGFTNIKFLSQECNEDLKKIFNEETDGYNKTLIPAIKNLCGESFVNNYNEIMKRVEG